MPPKRASKKEMTPVRRSARIQSREPSAETETVPQITSPVAEPPPIFSPSPERSPAKRSKMSRVQRELRLEKIHEGLLQSQLAEDAAQSVLLPPPSPPPSQLATSPPQQRPQGPEAAGKTTPPQDIFEKQPASGWRKMLSYFTSPFGSKRAAEEDDLEQPSHKRARVEEPEHTTATTPVRSAPEEPVKTSDTMTPHHDSAAQQTRKRKHDEPPVHTPGSAIGYSPRDHAGPSAKDLMPTSLSTITEYTEPSFISNLSQIEEGTPTPSKPPRAEPQRRLLSVPQSTPLRMTQNTPRRTPMGTPTIRRAALLRAAREANTDSRAPATGFFAPVQRATPKPRETNADARQAKLERMRELQRELEELQQDEDIKEMQSHKRKRVKIDHLVTIPHNLPGDPSGMFRVPEGDSDDEMEVYDDVEERSNVFEESERMDEDVQTPVPAQASVAAQPSVSAQPPASAHTPFSRGVQTPAQAPTPATTQTSKRIETAAPVQASAPALFTPQPIFSLQRPVEEAAPEVTTDLQFDFPDVGPIPEGYYVSEEYKEEAGRLFAEGYAAWIATQ